MVDGCSVKAYCLIGDQFSSTRKRFHFSPAAFSVFYKYLTVTKQMLEVQLLARYPYIS